MKNNINLDLGEIRVNTFTQNLITEDYVSWLNDPVVVRFSEQRHHHHTIASCQSYFESINKSDNYFLSIISKDINLTHIGNITVTVDMPNSIADISIMVGNRQSWGRSLGLKAWIGVQNYFLNDLGFRKVTAGTMAGNIAMINLIKRSGMCVDCIRPKIMLWEGQEADIVYASITSQTEIS